MLPEFDTEDILKKLQEIFGRIENISLKRYIKKETSNDDSEPIEISLDIPTKLTSDPYSTLSKDVKKGEIHESEEDELENTSSDVNNFPIIRYPVIQDYPLPHLKPGLKFPSKEAACEYIETFCKATLSPMVIARNDGKKGMRRISYKCPHGMMYKSNSKGMRKVKRLAHVDCPVVVNINQQADGGFVVTKAITEHENHEIGKEIFDKYARNRRLTKDHDDAVRAFLDTDPTATEVAQLLKDITGKDYSSQDANNIIKRLKRTKLLG